MKPNHDWILDAHYDKYVRFYFNQRSFFTSTTTRQSSYGVFITLHRTKLRRKWKPCQYSGDVILSLKCYMRAHTARFVMHTGVKHSSKLARMRVRKAFTAGRELLKSHNFKRNYFTLTYICIDNAIFFFSTSHFECVYSMPNKLKWISPKQTHELLLNTFYETTLQQY